MMSEFPHSNEKNICVKVTNRFAQFLTNQIELRSPPILLKVDEMDSWIDSFLYGKENQDD